MDEQQVGLPREVIAFQKMADFHLQRVSAVATGDVPLQQRDGGILVLHLIPESCVFSRNLLDGRALKEAGTRIQPLGAHGGCARFNVDGFLNCSGHQQVDAYSQLFRDGRLESVMSDVGYPLNSQTERSSYIVRSGLLERSVFDIVQAYLRFCKTIGFEQPVWLFSALVECEGFRMTDGFRDMSRKAVDRSPAVLPELEITSFDTVIEQLLRPWCDGLWQAGGHECSLSYDQDGDWCEPR